MQTVTTADFSTFNGKVTRFVEGQSFISTRILVDTLDEQELLERLIDDAKPPAITKNNRGELHYLLYTPFRYPPLRSGGRFHKSTEPSLFYAADNANTASAEIAYYRFRFANDSAAALTASYVDYTSFKAKISTDAFIYLTKPPFDADRSEISNPLTYGQSQPLGAQMRALSVAGFDFFAARSTGINYGFYTPEVFARNTPVSTTHWKVYITAQAVEFSSNFGKNRIEYARTDFEIDGHLAVI